MLVKHRPAIPPTHPPTHLHTHIHTDSPETWGVPSERPLAVHAAVLLSSLAILLRLPPLKLCLYPAVPDLPATPPPLPTHCQACGRWCLHQLARPGQARLTQGHTSPLGLIAGGHFIFISQMLFVGKSGR